MFFYLSPASAGCLKKYKEPVCIHFFAGTTRQPV